MTPFMAAAHVCVSLIDDLGHKRNRKISELLQKTFGEG